MIITFRSTQKEILSLDDFITFINENDVIKNLIKLPENKYKIANQFYLEFTKINYSDLKKLLKKKLFDTKNAGNKKYWIDRGYDELTAIQKAYAVANTTSIKSFIKRYGEVEGKKRYNYFAEKNGKAHTLNGMIERYGDAEGRIKFKNFSENSVKTILKLHSNGNFTPDISMNKTKLIEKYGEIDGLKKFNEINENRKYWHSLEYHIKKYGEVDGLKIFKRKKEKLHEFYRGRASKESLKFLIPLYKKLRENGIERNDIYIGLKGSKEYFLIDEHNKIYFYDFTILSKKIIIEYNGEKFHPNLKYKDTEKWNKWKSPFSKLNADNVLIRDLYKEHLAINKGFVFYKVYSSDNLELKLQEIYEKAVMHV